MKTKTSFLISWRLKTSSRRRSSSKESSSYRIQALHNHQRTQRRTLWMLIKSNNLMRTRCKSSTRIKPLNLAPRYPNQDLMEIKKLTTGWTNLTCLRTRRKSNPLKTVFPKLKITIFKLMINFSKKKRESLRLRVKVFKN